MDEGAFLSKLEAIKPKNQRIYLKDLQVVIKTIPFNNNLLNQYIWVGLLLWITIVIPNEGFSQSSVTILWILMLYLLWIEFSYVNVITVNTKEQWFSVASQNVIEKMIFKKHFIHFDEVDEFYEDERRYRYVLKCRLKNEASIILTDFGKKEQATDVCECFNALL